MKIYTFLLRARCAISDLLIQAIPTLSQTIRVTASGGQLPQRSALLKAPLNHRLDYARRIYPLYDVILPLTASLVGREYPEEAIIDVGANIGDTTALFRLHGCNNRIHAFEPVVKFADYVRKNISANTSVYQNVILHQALVGSKKEAPKALVQYASTASVKLAGNDSPASSPDLQVAELSDCDESAYCFVKIDTDGYDFT
ncbi:MAG: FkbM family methyltransferase, partial [Verrucomicrobiaceae bacterium]